jgi:hypothetical protein
VNQLVVTVKRLVVGQVDAPQQQQQYKVNNLAFVG